MCYHYFRHVPAFTPTRQAGKKRGTELCVWDRGQLGFKTTNFPQPQKRPQPTRRAGHTLPNHLLAYIRLTNTRSACDGCPICRGNHVVAVIVRKGGVAAAVGAEPHGRVRRHHSLRQRAVLGRGRALGVAGLAGLGFVVDPASRPLPSPYAVEHPPRRRHQPLPSLHQRHDARFRRAVRPRSRIQTRMGRHKDIPGVETSSASCRTRNRGRRQVEPVETARPSDESGVKAKRFETGHGPRSGGKTTILVALPLHRRSRALRDVSSWEDHHTAYRSSFQDKQQLLLPQSIRTSRGWVFWRAWGESRKPVHMGLRLCWS
ncbi:hypothetical protein VTK73DRAFT_2544 [Phialemonium thermophilum]|uniref:Uncharacterized protein n=1 Tax=Phialemonium thermophilum TaxID=223376 RepID=A0ABR3VS02_9PEZI